MRKPLIAGTLAVALLAGCGADDQAAPPMPPAAVEVVTLQVQPVTLTRELPGRTAASRTAEVRPQVSGLVRERLFKEGSLVEQGQPLYQLDDRGYRADLASAEAALHRARATVEAARTRAQRSAELVKTGVVPAQQNEEAVAALKQAEADVAAARAAVQRQQLDVQYARITAPIGGRIGTSAVTEGALVTANQAAPLAVIHQLDPIHVDISAPVEELHAFRRQVADGMQAGQDGIAVTLLRPDGTPHPHPGHVQSTDLSVDPATGSFSLRVVADNPEHLLLPGMYVRAVAELGVRTDALLVPQRGVTRDPKGGATAMVVQADGTVAVRQLQATQAIGDQWLVDGGLQAGDRVIVAGLQKVQPGAKVEASEAGSAATAPAAGAPTPPPAPEDSQPAGER